MSASSALNLVIAASNAGPTDVSLAVDGLGVMKDLNAAGTGLGPLAGKTGLACGDNSTSGGVAAGGGTAGRTGFARGVAGAAASGRAGVAATAEGGATTANCANAGPAGAGAAASTMPGVELSPTDNKLPSFTPCERESPPVPSSEDCLRGRLNMELKT